MRERFGRGGKASGQWLSTGPVRQTRKRVEDPIPALAACLLRMGVSEARSDGQDSSLSQRVVSPPGSKVLFVDRLVPLAMAAQKGECGLSVLGVLLSLCHSTKTSQQRSTLQTTVTSYI